MENKNKKSYTIEDIIEVEIQKIIIGKDLSGACYDVSLELGSNLWLLFSSKENRDILKSINKYPTNLNYELIHGEIGFTLEVPSEYWGIQHTWLKVEVYGLSFYIDATISQFKDIIPNTPKYYISRDTPPKWFLEDRRNIKLHKTIKYTKLYDIIGWCQYEVIGKVYDFIRKLKK